MDIKKKLGIGVLTGALGLSLIGGGTWAAFNDVEEVSHSFTAGVLDLAIGEGTTMGFEVSNLKPGDSFTKKLVLHNNGNLDINQIIASVSSDDPNNFDDKDILDLNTKVGPGSGDNDLNDFLSQFTVTVTKDGQGLGTYNLRNLVGLSEDITLTNNQNEIGLEVGETSEFEFEFMFIDDQNTFNNSRYKVQNKYQGESANIYVELEATQMPGEDRSNDTAQ